MQDPHPTTSIEHRALPLTIRTPSVWPHCLGKNWGLTTRSGFFGGQLGQHLNSLQFESETHGFKTPMFARIWTRTLQFEAETLFANKRMKNVLREPTCWDNKKIGLHLQRWKRRQSILKAREGLLWPLNLTMGIYNTLYITATVHCGSVGVHPGSLPSWEWNYNQTSSAGVCCKPQWLGSHQQTEAVQKKEITPKWSYFSARKCGSTINSLNPWNLTGENVDPLSPWFRDPRANSAKHLVGAMKVVHLWWGAI